MTNFVVTHDRVSTYNLKERSNALSAIFKLPTDEQLAALQAFEVEEKTILSQLRPPEPSSAALARAQMAIRARTETFPLPGYEGRRLFGMYPMPARASEEAVSRLIDGMQL
ncbi:Uncharacterised protein (plasmid) [Legionella adelaidensis]|uniref:Uncharacterized protein n=1 Tax=Legionella adelaidensis TaxID=45056 RepID=A0A0W0R3Y5_9GAMM|nr:hypothetical protein [Legionella adelaidensis]KTC65746.1 hypothetical protein Lade_0404 [Legionella adelaidensis]VEH85088.1 Uncharacterised protein [Legionella adelaidensis]